MSKRLTTSAIVATLLMAATSFYSTAQHAQTAAVASMMGG